VHLAIAPFLALSILLILVPGPDTAVVTKNALAGGRRGGVYAAFGVTIGLTVWTLATALGVAAILRASEDAFLALKIVGAVYLIWIGIQLLRMPGAQASAGDRRRASGRRALRQGVLTDLGNPKVGVFFTSFLPQFVHGGGSPFLALVLLGAIFTTLTLLWLAVWGIAVGRGTALLHNAAVRRWLDRITGVIFVGFGIDLALEHR
jgi:RhtB (resistance to homoserine/threonine) family protein